MEKNKDLLRGILIITLAVLMLPVVQYFIPFIKEDPLYGYKEKAIKDTLTIAKWWDGIYQSNQEKFLEDTFPCRKSIIRLTNQIDYSLFNKARASAVVVGEKNYLFQQEYIDNYYGQDFIGEDSIRQSLIKLKKIQDTLRKINKDIVFVIAPSKAYFHPEYIPSQYRLEDNQVAN